MSLKEGYHRPNQLVFKAPVKEKKSVVVNGIDLLENVPPRTENEVEDTKNVFHCIHRCGCGMDKELFLPGTFFSVLIIIIITYISHLFPKAPAHVFPAAGGAPASEGRAQRQGCTNTPTGAGAQQPEER